MVKLNRAIISVDTGFTGAIVLNYQGKVKMWDMPVTDETFLSNQKHCLDTIACMELLKAEFDQFDDGTQVVFVTEQMQAMGRLMPARTLLGLVEMSSAIETTIQFLGWSTNRSVFIRKYQPRFWIQRIFPGREKRSGKGETAKKNESLDLARELFPELADKLSRKKDHNRAEALLLSFMCLIELAEATDSLSSKAFQQMQNDFHVRSFGEHSAKFTHVLGLWAELPNALKQEIQKRVNPNK